MEEIRKENPDMHLFNPLRPLRRLRLQSGKTKQRCQGM
jgi:hypothetical protein